MASPVTATLELRRPSGGSAAPCVAPREVASVGEVATAKLSFEAIYEEHFAFVWRSLRRLGVREAAVDDAVQEVFLVAHRRLAGFEGRSSVKRWMFGIVVRVARTFRRTAQRRPEGEGSPAEDGEGAAESSGLLPDEHVERNEAVELLHDVLEELGDEKREVFVLAELEEMTAPEIAEAVGISLSNVYGRLRAARQAFEQALARRRAQDAWRLR